MDEAKPAPHPLRTAGEHSAWIRMRRPKGAPTGGRAMDGPQQRVYAPQARRRMRTNRTTVGPTTPPASARVYLRSRFRRVIAGLATALLPLLLMPQASAEFVSACGTAPSGINDCPWYQVEIVIFRNDNARNLSIEDLGGDAKPRWSPRLATLLPSKDEYFVPIRPAEYLALWQSTEQAPEWLRGTPRLTLEQERFLLVMNSIGRPRHPIDLGFLDELGELSSGNTAVGGDDPVISGGTEIGEPSPTGEEISPANAQESLPERQSAEVPDLIDVIPMDLAFREIPAGQRLLDGEAARLRRASGFDVLAQLSWRQPFIPEEPGVAQLVYTADIAETQLPEGELLLGTLTVDLRRFLHAHLDLYFKAAEHTPWDVDMGREEDTYPSPRDGAAEWIHVQQSRRMRSGELHYLDHPWIGAIIRIERYEVGPPEE